ncbi:MAG: hypothetical protein ACKVOX_05675 [Rhizobacter sp.]
MSGSTRNSNIASDTTTGDVVGLIGGGGREVAHPGNRIDSSAVPGAATQHGATMGRVAIAAGASSVVVTNRLVTTASTILAVISQSAADGTLTQILRVAPGAGSFTISGNANATAATQVDWCLFGLIQ